MFAILPSFFFGLFFMFINAIFSSVFSNIKDSYIKPTNPFHIVYISFFFLFHLSRCLFLFSLIQFFCSLKVEQLLKSSLITRNTHRRVPLFSKKKKKNCSQSVVLSAPLARVFFSILFLYNVTSFSFFLFPFFFNLSPLCFCTA